MNIRTVESRYRAWKFLLCYREHALQVERVESVHMGPGGHPDSPRVAQREDSRPSRFADPVVPELGDRATLSRRMIRSVVQGLGAGKQNLVVPGILEREVKVTITRRAHAIKPRRSSAPAVHDAGRAIHHARRLKDLAAERRT